MNIPKISVIMSVYNGEKYLREAISSIVKQTYTDFEFIIIDDGSLDTSKDIITSFHDTRIKLYTKNHEGLISALNFAIGESKGEYIARMDADDIAYPDRFEKQISFMEVNNLVVCGSYADGIDQYGKTIREMQYPPKGDRIKQFTLIHNPFIHPSVMIRRDIFQKVGGYKKFFKHIEDYELWTRIVFKYKTDNIPEVLLHYRFHTDQITKKQNLGMRARGIFVRVLALYRYIVRV